MRISVVVGSTRPGRLGDRVCRFVMSKALQVGGAEFTVVDLSDYPMPFFDEPAPPMNNPDRHPVATVKAWLDAMRDADAYVFLTPEYNHAPPAVLKNALDYLSAEAEGKPATIVSYSTSQHGGTLANQHLRMSLGKAGMHPLPRSLSLPRADQLLDENGELTEKSDWAGKVERFIVDALQKLVEHSFALKVVREKEVASL